MEDDELITVATFNTITRAEAARDRLAADGIRAMVLDHESAPADNASAFALAASLGGVKLLVRAGDEDRAVEALDRFARLPTEKIAEAPSPSPSSDAIATKEDAAAAAEPAAESGETKDEESAEAPQQDVSVQTTEREVLAERTLRAQIFSFVFWPLQLVTLIFLIQVAASKERLSDKARQSFAMALGLHAVLWVLFFIVWMVLPR